MTDQSPRASIQADAPTLAAMHDLEIGESLRAGYDRVVVKRIEGNRWLVSVEVEHSGDLVPMAYLGSDGKQLDVRTEVPALLPRRVKPWQLDITFQTTQFDEAAFNQLVEEFKRQNP